MRLTQCHLGEFHQIDIAFAVTQITVVLDQLLESIIVSQAGTGHGFTQDQRKQVSFCLCRQQGCDKILIRDSHYANQLFQFKTVIGLLPQFFLRRTHATALLNPGNKILNFLRITNFGTQHGQHPHPVHQAPAIDEQPQRGQTICTHLAL